MKNFNGVYRTGRKNARVAPIFVEYQLRNVKPLRLLIAVEPLTTWSPTLTKSFKF
jgi:hypothetical protein